MNNTFASLFALLLIGSPAMTDTLISKDGQHFGMLSAYGRGVCVFLEFNQPKPTAFNLDQVSKIVLSKPVNADFLLDYPAGKTTSGLFLAYRRGQFHAIINGRKQRLSPRQFSGFSITISLGEFEQARETWKQDHDKQTQHPPRKAREYAQPGKITIVHFHDGSASSTRQGNLCQRLQQDAPQLVTYIKLKAPLGSPVATINGLRSTPQFWFFSSQGELMRRLDRRFTEEDIETAMARIRRRH